MRLRIQSKDSLTPLYWLGGADCRKPRRQFWTDKGFRELPHDSLKDEGEDISGEFMHFTVRLLAEYKVMERCKSLRHVRVPTRSKNQADPVVWRLPMVSRPGLRRLLHSLKVLFKPQAASEEYSVSEVPMRREHGCSYPELARELVLLMKWSDSELDVLQHSADENEPKPKAPVALLKAFVSNMLEDFIEEMILDLEPEMQRMHLTTTELRDIIEHELWG